MTDILHDIASRLYDGEEEAVAGLVRQALAQGLSPHQVLQGGLIAGMDVVGRDFKAGELFVPEVLIAARAMHAGLEVLRPLLAESEVPTVGKYLIGTVKGDLHDIGKNLVASMLEGGGFQVIDLGVDVPCDKFVDAVKEKDGTILALSALLTTTMIQMKNVIKALESAGLRKRTKVMIGGAPITQQYADEIGADGYSDNASGAVHLARKLLGLCA